MIDAINFLLDQEQASVRVWTVLGLQMQVVEKLMLVEKLNNQYFLKSWTKIMITATNIY